MTRFWIFLSLVFSTGVSIVAQEIPISNPGFEIVSRPLDSGEITNGAGGDGVLVGTRLSLFDPPQFDDVVEIPGWRTFLPTGDPITILTGVLNPPATKSGKPFVAGFSGQYFASARNVWMQQTLNHQLVPNTRYRLTFLCGSSLTEPGDGVFAGMVATPDLNTLAFAGVPGTTTLALSNFLAPEIGQMFSWTVDFITPKNLPEHLQNHYIAIAFVGGDGITLMNFDDFQLVAATIGDVNGDGQVDLLDIQPFVELLTSGSYQFEADTNQDGIVDLLDIDPFVEILGG